MSATRPVLVIGNKNYSSWSLRPWLLMREGGVAFDERRLLLDTPLFAEQVGALSPTRRVPVLHDGDLVIWDSLAICEYANERWLGGSGWPADRATRAWARSASAEMHSGFPALRSELPMNCRRRPDGYRWSDAAQADIERVQQLWRELLTRAADERGFLCGRFGIVDAMFAPVVVRFVGYGVPCDEMTRRYMDTVRVMPSMQAWWNDALGEADVIEGSEKRG